MKFFLKTYGCTFNQADGDALKQKVAAAGHEFSGETEADLIILNTCAVKKPTQEKILRKIRDCNGRRLLVTGCLAQATPELVEKANPRASILGTFAQQEILEAVEKTARGDKTRIIERKETVFNSGLEGIVARIQISRGCNSQCFFCETKLARGNVESRPLKEVVRAIEEALALGAKEIQLCSQDTGCYGIDSGTDLVELLRAIDGIDGDFFVRLGMLNPMHAKKMLAELVDVFDSRKLYKFIHIPVQSGSEKVLEEMNRKHSARDFEEVVAAFRKKFPEITVETDLIVGYPTETEEDFLETVEMVKRVEPDIVNVSRFSAMPKTVAARMKQLPHETVAARSRELNELCRRISLEKNRKMVGKKYEVLVVENARNGFLARNSFYKPVLVQKGVLGEFVEATVLDAGESHLKAF